MDKDRSIIRKSLESIFAYQQYDIEPYLRHYALDQYFLKYSNINEVMDKIKVEINYVYRVPILGLVKKKTLLIFDYKIPVINTFQQEELYGSKIKTLIERTAPRDLFDIYIISMQNNMNRDILRRTTLLLMCTEIPFDFREKMNDNYLDGISENDFNNSLIPMLRKNDKLRLDIMKKKVKDYLDKLLIFTHEENEFIELFYKKQFYPELLFPKNKQLMNMPSALWCIKNM